MPCFIAHQQEIKVNDKRCSEKYRGIAIVLFFLCLTNHVTAADWPMWRYDSGHTAASPAVISTELKLLWSNQYTARQQVWQDALNRDLMPYDKVFEPIVAGKRLFLNFNDSDKVIALDTSTGKQLWSFYTDAPVRFPPVAHQDKLYFVSDDGCLYCLQQRDGSLVWKFSGAPSPRKVIGNRRVISSWPARGAPVIADDTVYFAAGIWPFMGTFIYALDLQTGKVQWINDETASTYIQQPHNSPAFAGVAPQGIITIAGDKLLIPGGRSVPAVLDRKTGKQLYFHLAKNKKVGGSSVFSLGDHFFVHQRKSMFSLFRVSDGKKLTRVQFRQPVLTKQEYYTSGKNVAAYSTGEKMKKLWTLDVDAGGDLIKVGNALLIAGGKKSISLIQIAGDHKSAKVIKTINVKGNVERLIAADDKLFAVSAEGLILAFGKNLANESSIDVVKSAAETTSQLKQSQISQTIISQAKNILQQANVNEGYALFYGIGDGNLLQALAQQSKLHIVALESDREKIKQLRRRFDQANLYGKRIAIVHGNLDQFQPPQYMASLTVIHDPSSVGYQHDEQSLKKIYRSIRPYGGTLVMNQNDRQHQIFSNLITKSKLPKSQLHGAKLIRTGTLTMLRREGSLLGAGTWTHQYGNIANTIKSEDKLVKLPLGILWFGGNTNADVLPRHGHGPPEQVVGGRCFLQGMNLLSARDVYTGRVLWKVELKRLGTGGLFFDKTYLSDPFSTKYGQKHIPGANARGTNMVATEKQVYIIQQDECHMLDSATGKTLDVFQIDGKKNASESKASQSESDKKTSWGYLGVYDKYLLGGRGFANFTSKINKKKKKTKKKTNYFKYDTSASAALIVMDRMTGEIHWKRTARYGFIHNAITVANDTIYCLDKYPPHIEQKLNRRGEDLPTDYRLLAIDIKTGKVRWQTTKNVFGTWLSFSKKHSLLLQSNRPSRDMILGEIGKQMIVYHANSGKILWNKKITYKAPPILHGENILVAGAAFQLKSGEPVMRADPITGKSIPWTYSRSYGCSYPIASENLITFRSASAGFYDLLNESGSGHFGGFKSGCTSSLIAADGVLNAPDYTRTCSCAYQNQTSLAMVHMPELEMWTHNNFTYKNQEVQQVGINFGAAGDRRASDGTLWLEHPQRGSPSPQINFDIQGSLKYFRHHASRIRGSGTTWVAGSGMIGESEISISLIPQTKPKDGGYRITSSAGDAEETIATGEVNLKSSDLELGSDKKEKQIVGLRFEKIDIPRGKIIREAYVQFNTDEPSKVSTSISISGQADDHAPLFSISKNNLSKRNRTKRKLAWKPGKWEKGARDKPQKTPNLASIIQEIISRDGWKKGNSLALFFEGNGVRTADSFDGNRNKTPALHIVMEGSQRKISTTSSVRRYTVKLHFIEPEFNNAGKRLFNVQIQEKTMLKDFDIAKEANGKNRSLIKTFQHVAVKEKLTIKLIKTGDNQPVLCGIEIIAEKRSRFDPK